MVVWCTLKGKIVALGFFQVFLGKVKCVAEHTQVLKVKLTAIQLFKKVKKIFRFVFQYFLHKN
jgi:hypothetical protein